MVSLLKWLSLRSIGYYKLNRKSSSKTSTDKTTAKSSVKKRNLKLRKVISKRLGGRKCTSGEKRRVVLRRTIVPFSRKEEDQQPQRAAWKIPPTPPKLAQSAASFPKSPCQSPTNQRFNS